MCLSAGCREVLSSEMQRGVGDLCCSRARDVLTTIPGGAWLQCWDWRCYVRGPFHSSYSIGDVLYCSCIISHTHGTKFNFC